MKDRQADDQAGFLEKEHTADWEIEVWAPDLAGLMVQAARGMAALTGLELGQPGSEQREIHLQAGDAEGLIVDFLGELLWAGEQEGLAFDRFDLQVSSSDGGLSLDGRMSGGKILAQSKEIKAVTYHRLEVKETVRGLEAGIVFDV